jgi:hypothetical protein
MLMSAGTQLLPEEVADVQKLFAEYDPNGERMVISALLACPPAAHYSRANPDVRDHLPHVLSATQALD